ncbi:MAG: TonB-dependent receptor [Deltaproteobacteria bacterium]|nr:TonB-dependent receptor [Deltaproteobacteria bacterium]
MAADTDADLGDMSLDQLMGITVTSVSKKAQSADEVSSAIFVLTQDDIRRSGAVSVAEVLRLVPGVQVARNSSSGWSVTARGFNGRFASKLLVLMDGRSVYTPLFSGVYWDVQDTMLEDIERIEVIRGPGATVWGANAVNGVINIITKDAKDTHGLLATAGGGNEEQGFGGIRYGGEIGDLDVRGYAKYFNRDGQVNSRGIGRDDNWDVGRAGFRMDWDASEDDKVTFQGDFYDGEAGMDFTGLSGPTPIPTRYNEDQEFQGLNVITRWSHTFSETQDASIQFYYDRTDRTTPLVDEIRDTLDLEFQHRFGLPFNQEVIWGGGYRYTADDVDGTFAASTIPEERHDDTFSFFVQDEVRFFDDMARLTFGTKVEVNDYTKWEYQPSVRLAVVPNDDHTFWAAVSRAVRVPSRADDNILLNVAFAPNVPPGFPNPLDPTVICPPVIGCPATTVAAMGTGTRTSESERLYAFEAGWRARFFERVTLDVSAFYNDYDFLESFENGPLVVTSPPVPFPGPWTATQTILLLNGDNGETYGVELDLRTDITDWWRVIVAYSWFHGDDPSDPTHTGVVRSQLDLPMNFEFDTTVYFVGNTFIHSAAGLEVTTPGPIPSYTRVDLRLGWKPTDNVEISLVGQNINDARHPEFASELGIAATQVQRSYYGKVTFEF